MENYTLERQTYEPHFDDLQYVQYRFINRVEQEFQTQQHEITLASRDVTRLTREVIRDQVVRLTGFSGGRFYQNCLNSYDYRLRSMFDFELTAILESHTGASHLYSGSFIGAYERWLLFNNPYEV